MTKQEIKVLIFQMQIHQTTHHQRAAGALNHCQLLQTRHHHTSGPTKVLIFSIAATPAQRTLGSNRQTPPLSSAPRPAPPSFRTDFPALLPGTRIYRCIMCTWHELPGFKASRNWDFLRQQSSAATVDYIPHALNHLGTDGRSSWSGSGSLQIQDPSFLSNNQQLVNFINANDHSTPPHWSIKTYTQSFFNHYSNENCKVFKIDRTFNTTAHLLPRQAFAAAPVLTNVISLVQTWIMLTDALMLRLWTL